MSKRYWLQIFELDETGKPGAFVGHHIFDVQRAKEAARRQLPVERFLLMRTAPEGGAFVGASELYDAYGAWARTERVPVLNQNMFGREMGELGHKSVKHGKRCLKCYPGLKLLPPGDDAAILRAAMGICRKGD